MHSEVRSGNDALYTVRDNVLTKILAILMTDHWLDERSKFEDAATCTERTGVSKNWEQCAIHYHGPALFFQISFPN